ncbi:MAG: hypothetical protein HYR85_19135 [Planctomycetes bacterium]|nr:hypothetical protein [Planctomycetota bacterium]MBI3845436.1 hypothetical protein [Planctomycetota bacterium]
MTPVVMPSWYAEGFTETFGGEGTFTWDGTKLDAKKAMSPSRLASEPERRGARSDE